MGWSWAFYLIQRAHSLQVLIGSGLSPSRQITDDAPVPDLSSGEPAVLTYCDNLNVVGVDRVRVDDCLSRVRVHLESLGLPIHEVTFGATTATSLGFEIDGSAAHGNVRPKAKRIQLICQTALWLSRRPRVTSASIEKFIGHFVHVALLRRESLSILRALYDFVAARFTAPVRLWVSAARECRWIRQVAPLLRADWRRPWSLTVTVSDACPSGIGVCETTWSQQEVEEVGRVSERWRYIGSTPAVRARKHVASLRLDPLVDLASVKAIGEPTLAVPRFERNIAFQEVSLATLARSVWRLCYAYRVRRREQIGILEARGVVSAMHHRARKLGNFDTRFIHLGDNLGDELTFTKGRGASFGILVCCRRAFCILGATNSICCHRWITSEDNVADGASRLWEGRPPSRPWRGPGPESGGEPGA